jgi:hypothetical protein
MIHTFQLQLRLAKVRRDEYMFKLHELFPSYEWNSNKGIYHQLIYRKISVSVSTIEHNMLEIFKINVKNLTRV